MIVRIVRSRLFTLLWLAGIGWFAYRGFWLGLVAGAVGYIVAFGWFWIVLRFANCFVKPSM
jgi:hypothetical protein